MGLQREEERQEGRKGDRNGREGELERQRGIGKAKGSHDREAEGRRVRQEDTHDADQTHTPQGGDDLTSPSQDVI